MTDIPATSPEPPPPPATQSVESKNQKPFIFILLGLFVVVIATIIAFSLISKDSVPTQNPPPAPSPATQPQTVTESGLVFIRNRELYFYDNQQAQKITETGGRITSHARSGKLLAYVVGHIPGTIEDQQSKLPTSVHLYDLDSKEDTQILEVPYSSLGEFSTMARDVEFSPDGSLLGLTSSDSFWIYNPAAKSLDQVFSFPATSAPANGVFAYVDPLFSPDNTKAVIRLGYYEGSSHSFVNLDTGDLTPLPDEYFSYVTGRSILHWLNNNQLIAVDREDFTDIERQERIEVIEAASLSTLKSFAIDGSVNSTVLVNQTLYTLSQVDKLTGQYTGPQNDIPVSDRYYQIRKIDMSTGTQSLLLEYKSNHGDAAPSPTRLVKYGSSLAVSATSYTTQNGSVELVSNDIFVLDPDQPNPTLEKLIPDASLLAY